MLRHRLAPLLIAATLLTVGQGCANKSLQVPAKSTKPVTLDYWRVVDDADAFDEVIKAYRALHPNVTINYRKLRVEEYERELIDALAEDRGPDVFTVHNTWMRAYEPKLLAMPSQFQLSFRELQGINKEPTWVQKTLPGMTVSQVRSDYVDQVAQDVVITAATDDPKQGLVPQIFGLPLAMDTMVLFHNRDVLNAAGIPTPATTWGEFQDHVKRMTRYDSQGKLLKPAAGIGTSRNVDRSFDILSLLMMQNGAEMTDENGYPRFNRVPSSMADREVAPGVEALVFYTDFANPAKEVFTWDDAQPNSYDAFVAGKTGYFFGYSYHLQRIKAQAPKLNFGVAAMPQIDPNRRVNTANYWIESVSKKTDIPDIAWDFVRFAADGERVKGYLAKTGKPTARRGLVNEQLGDEDLTVFASQVLTAKSWYRGVNIEATEATFAEMIDSTLRGADPAKAANLAVQTVAQTIR